MLLDLEHIRLLFITIAGNAVIASSYSVAACLLHGMFPKEVCRTHFTV
jgi:hypothetical protein